MRKLVLAIIGVFVFVTLAYAAVNWKTANQATVAWDPVTTLQDGSTIPAGSVMSYKVFLANAITDPNKTNPVEVPVSAQCDGVQTQCTITLNTEGKYYVGVKALRSVDGTVVAESTVAWSDLPEYTNETPFGMQFFENPAAPKGMH